MEVKAMRRASISYSVNSHFHCSLCADESRQGSKNKAPKSENS